jgi:hypothetical protein
MATKTAPGAYDCYHRALPDEPIFTLLARSPEFADTVAFFAGRRAQRVRASDAPISDLELVMEAQQCAADGEAWRVANDGAWRRPANDWARVEIFGHRQHHGRVCEELRFGARMLRIDVPTRTPGIYRTLYYAGSAIFGLSPCSEREAREEEDAELPAARAPDAPDSPLPPDGSPSLRFDGSPGPMAEAVAGHAANEAL